MMQSSSYSAPLATMPRSVMRSTPRPSVSTSVTFGRLKVCRYSSWKAWPLAELPVVGLQRLGGVRVVDDRLGAGADLLHLLEVGELDGLHDGGRVRRRVAAVRRPRSSLPMISVQPS
jgi:hypothetical protein